MKKLITEWRKYLQESLKIVIDAEEAGKEVGGKEKICPAPTQDLMLNTANRDRAIKVDFIKYGPLNVEKPGDFWKNIAKKWGTSEKAAMKSKCASCTAFDISPRMVACIPGKTSQPVKDEFGVLGYCWMHQFKCHSARSCNTWAAGGPIEEDNVSYEWQERKSETA